MMTKSHFGMIGLGTMGRNFLLNIAEHGIHSVGYDLDAGKRDLLSNEGAGLPVTVGTDMADFIAKLESPRNIMLLVPAGPIVDSVIAELLPLLDDDDLIIDGGNSHFTDTERRITELDAKGVGFMGIGVSGGEEGARHGASIMPGGKRSHYDRIESILQAVSAKVNGEPCVAYLGEGSAGHFVKMVHNGIEYALMQLIAESYDLIKCDGRTNAEIAETFAKWNRGRLNSFLIEITSIVLRKTDPETGNSLVEMILDTARQKGTGKWTSQAAMDLGVPIPAIDSAVTMRQISAQKSLREKIGGQFPATGSWQIDECQLEDKDVESALHCSFIAAYSQGFALLQAASDEMGFELDMAEIAKIWRGGCIIRASMLEDIRAALSEEPKLVNLIASHRFQAYLSSGREDLSRLVRSTASAGIPAMVFAATLNYVTALSTMRLPANLIQAQRDYFGAHTYQRTDREGSFHTDWQ